LLNADIDLLVHETPLLCCSAYHLPWSLTFQKHRWNLAGSCGAPAYPVG